MTKNQIDNRAQRETARSNQAREEETSRHNRATEKQAKWDTQVKTGSNLLNTGLKAVLGKINDPSWYNLDKQLVQNTANLAYGKPLGTPYSVGQTAALQVTGSSVVSNVTPSYDGRIAFPGIMHLKFMPTIGVNGVDNSAGIDVAAKNIYSYIRHANSGSANYESEDLMLYLLAMDSIYTGIAWFMRVYSLLNDYKSDDYYFSKNYLRAMGISPSRYCINAASSTYLSSYYNSTPYAHIADFRAWINVQIQRINSLRVPDVMPLFKRHMWLTSNIFKDDSIKKSSNYIFSPRCLYVYSASEGLLSPMEWPATATTSLTTQRSDLTGLFDCMMMFEYALENIIGDEDIGIMSGDIQKAYGDSGLVNLSSMPDDFHVETTYSEEVLSQIRNITLVPIRVCPLIGQDASGYLVNGYTAEDGVVTESPITINGAYLDSESAVNVATVINPGTYSGGYTYSSAVFYPGTGATVALAANYSMTEYTSFPKTHTAQTAASGTLVLPVNESCVISMWKDDVTPDENMVATRLCATTISDSTLCDVRVTSCGTEIITTAEIVIINDAITDDYQKLAVAALAVFPTGSSSGTFGYTSTYQNEYVWAISKFDNMFPVRMASTSSPATLTMLTDGIINDVSNYVVVSYNTLSAMHTVAIISEFGVPLIGTRTRK